MYLAQAGVFLIAILGFLIIFLTFRSNGNLEWAVMVPDEEEECEALVGQCWEHKHENHILHYQHTEAKNI